MGKRATPLLRTVAKSPSQAATPPSTKRCRVLPDSTLPDALTAGSAASASSMTAAASPRASTVSVTEQAQFSVQSLNADVWAQYGRDVDTVLGAFPNIVEQDAVLIMDGSDKKKTQKDKLGGRQEVFAEERSHQMLLGSGESIFAGNFWWAEAIPISGSVIRASAIEEYRSEHRESWPSMLEPMLLVVVVSPDQLTHASKGKWRSLGSEEIRMSVVAECAQIIRGGDMSLEATRKWEHMFRTCAFKAKVAPEIRWKYLAIDQRRELQSSSNAIARLPTQMIVEIGLHRESLMNIANTASLDSNVVAQDLREGVSVQLKDDDFGDKLVKEALSVFDRAFTQPKVLKIAITDVEKYGANAVFNQVAKHDKVVSVGRNPAMIEWIYTSMFDRREHGGGMLHVGFREFAGSGAQSPGLILLHKFQKDMLDHLLNKWLPSVGISQGDLQILKPLLASHASLRTAMDGSQAWRQDLGPSALASFEFVEVTTGQRY
jgi:hypothetical protein